MDPWRDDDEPSSGERPRGPSNWGCAFAAIIGSIVVVVAVVIALSLANGFAGDLLKDLR
jgi:ABC-type lipoprotein release transport system permease subunit